MSKKILVVDDEPDIVKTLSVALELDGYTVCTALSGAEAIEKVRSQSPDLAIIDMVLPGMTGAQVAHWIKNSREHRHIPVILITALAQQSEQKQLEEEQIECRLIKPFDLEQLEGMVAELLDCRRQDPAHSNGGTP